MTDTPHQHEPLSLTALFAPHERTVPVMLTRQAESHGDRLLVSTGGVNWTFNQAREAASRFAGVLRGAGIGTGDRVALICSNRIEFLQAFLGCAWLGAVAVPVNTASRGHQLQHILSNSGARLMIIEDAFRTNLDQIDVAALPLETIWTVDGDTPIKAGTIVSTPLPAAGAPVAPAAPLTLVGWAVLALPPLLAGAPVALPTTVAPGPLVAHTCGSSRNGGLLLPPATILRPADAGVSTLCRTSSNRRSAFARPPGSGRRTSAGARRPGR
jgi:non-ribosomal peptide synthetase component F